MAHLKGFLRPAVGKGKLWMMIMMIQFKVFKLYVSTKGQGSGGGFLNIEIKRHAAINISFNQDTLVGTAWARQAPSWHT